MNALSEFLAEKKVSQKLFAADAGVDPSIVSRLCKSAMRPSLDLAVRIERLTEGAVPATSWVAEAQAPAEPAPEPRSDAA